MGLIPDSVVALRTEAINNLKVTNEYIRGSGLKKAIHEPTSSKLVHQTDMTKDIS